MYWLTILRPYIRNFLSWSRLLTRRTRRKHRTSMFSSFPNFSAFSGFACVSYLIHHDIDYWSYQTDGWIGEAAACLPCYQEAAYKLQGRPQLVSCRGRFHKRWARSKFRLPRHDWQVKIWAQHAHLIYARPAMEFMVSKISLLQRGS